jgi:hypothetical protein
VWILILTSLTTPFFLPFLANRAVQTLHLVEEFSLDRLLITGGADDALDSSMLATSASDKSFLSSFFTGIGDDLLSMFLNLELTM